MAFSNSTPSQIQIPLLSSLAMALFVILAMTSKAYSINDTTSFTYDFYGSQPKTLTYQGDAFFPSDTTFLRLTKADALGIPKPGSIGRVLHSSPVLFKSQGAQASFETTINFIVNPKDGDKDPADGILFFVAPVGSTFPSAGSGSNFGVYTPSTGKADNVFAVEFDVYVNSAWDPKFRHIGINYGARKSDNVTSFEGVLGQQVTARINYEAATKVTTVYATASAGKFEVSYTYDLSNLLPEQVQVGLAASTGEHVAIHDVFSWYFSSTLVRNGIGADVVEIESSNLRQFV